MTTTYYLHLKKLERLGELEGAQFEYWDNKKLEKLCIELYGAPKHKQQRSTEVKAPTPQPLQRHPQSYEPQQPQPL